MIRVATAADAAAIARVHVESWRWAYRGHLPDDHLDGLSVESRAEGWTRLVARETPVFVAELYGRVVGFVALALHAHEGEVSAIYVDPSVAGTGMGRALMEHAVHVLRQRGYTSACLWVLETNDRARRFYEIAGWHSDGFTKVDDIDGVRLHEVRYSREL